MFVTKLNPAGSALGVLDLPGRHASRQRSADPVDAGGNAYAMGFSSSTGLPDHARRIRPDAERRLRRHPDEAQSRRLGPGLLDVPRRQRLRQRRRPGRRRRGQRLSWRAAPPRATSPTTRRGLTTPRLQQRRRVRDEAEPRRFGAGLLDVRRRLGGRGSQRHRARPGRQLLAHRQSPTRPTTRSRAGAPDTTFNGGVADAIITELNAAGSALLFSTFLGGSQSESGLRHRPRRHRRTSTSPATPIRRTSRRPSARSTGCSTATSRSSGATPSSRRSTSTPPRPHRRRRRRFRSRRRWSRRPTRRRSRSRSRSTGTTCPRPSSYTIQIDDSSAFTAPLSATRAWPSSVYATSDLATTTHFWRVRGVNSAGVAGAWSSVRSFTPQARPAARDAGDPRRQPVLGRRWHVGGRHGRHERRRDQRRDGVAVQQQPRGRQRSGDDDRGTRTASPEPSRHHLGRRLEHAGHDHRQLQRNDPDRAPDGHPRQARDRRCRA